MSPTLCPACYCPAIVIKSVISQTNESEDFGAVCLEAVVVITVESDQLGPGLPGGKSKPCLQCSLASFYVSGLAAFSSIIDQSLFEI